MKTTDISDAYRTNKFGYIKSPKGTPKDQPRSQMTKTKGDLRSKKG